MYLGIDFLISSTGEPFVIEANFGLPGGATEYDRAFRTRYGRPSGIFSAVDNAARRSGGLSFREQMAGWPFLDSLKSFKLWIDGLAGFPPRPHPPLRLEDKWVQYQVLRGAVPMPETMLLESGRMGPAEAFLERAGVLVSKPRSGRGGRGFSVVRSRAELRALAGDSRPRILQERIDFRAGRFTASMRAVAFDGEFLCAYVNLTEREFSNHGAIAAVVEGEPLGLERENFKVRRFQDRSWEAELWFEGREPADLRHNLYEDEAADAAFLLPGPLFQRIADLSVRVERLYNSLDFSTLPRAWFEVTPIGASSTHRSLE